MDKLELQWVFQAKSLEKFEATPLVVNGVLYTVQPPDDVFALDAATGRIFWTFAYNPSPKSRTCCGRVNRGLAILGDTLFLGTIDAHLIALDAKTGQVIWNTTVADVNEFYSITHAPLIVKDKVIVGTAGGDIGIGGLLAAYDVPTGKESGASTPSRSRAIRAMKPGRAIRGSTVAQPSGIPGPTIRRAISRSGALEIPRPTGMAENAAATISTAIRWWRWMRTPGS